MENINFKKKANHFNELFVSKFSSINNNSTVRMSKNFNSTASLNPLTHGARLKVIQISTNLQLKFVGSV